MLKIKTEKINTKVAVIIFELCTTIVNIKAIINNNISVIHPNGLGNVAFTAMRIPLAIGPTINKLNTLTIPNKQAINTAIDNIIQNRPVPPSPKASNIGMHQYVHFCRHILLFV